MGYKRFKRTNGIITLIGSIFSAVLSAAMMFFPSAYAMLGLFPVMLAYITVNLRIFGLTLKNDYDSNEYPKSAPHDIPKAWALVSALCQTAASVLCIIKAFFY